MGHRAADGSRRGGLRRGAGARKHGCERWATIWMDENFDYYSTLQNVENIEGGDDEEELEDAIEELYEIIEEWEDIAGRMGGTYFLDVCENLCWKILERAYQKVERFENELMMMEIANAMGGRGGGMLGDIIGMFF